MLNKCLSRFLFLQTGMNMVKSNNSELSYQTVDNTIVRHCDVGDSANTF